MLHPGYDTGMGTGYGEFSNVMNNQWRGINGKWYSMTHQPNQYTGARSLATDAADAFHTAGVWLAVTDAGVSTYEGYEYYENGDTLNASKSALDAGMSLTAFFGLPGFIVSSTYFVADRIIGWNNIGNAIQIASETDQEQEEITGESIYARPRIL